MSVELITKAEEWARMSVSAIGDYLTIIIYDPYEDTTTLDVIPCIDGEAATFKAEQVANRGIGFARAVIWTKERLNLANPRFGET